MKPLYTQAEFAAAKSQDRLPLECRHCGKTFMAKKSLIQTIIKGNSHYKSDFCSTRCGRLQFSKLLQCQQCNNPFYKQHSQIKKTKHNYCSQSCAAKYHNAHKTKGTRVSKLERWLQEQLPLLFPGLEFHFNRKDAIIAELDIYVPSLHLAFELNGIFHYEPIFGPEKLGLIQNNDERKTQACLEHGIGLCIIDVSTVSYFKPAKAQKFLDIIANLIHSRLSRDLPVSSTVAQSEPRGGSLTI